MDQGFVRQIAGFSLTTAEILYRLPDHPKLLQSYIWQDYDLAPRYPELRRFLAFWEKNLDGPLHSVKVANIPIIRPSETRFADAYLTLH